MPKRRFSFVPVVSLLLKIVATLVLLFIVYQAVEAFQRAIESWSAQAPSNPYMPAPPVPKNLGERLLTLLQPLGGVLFNMLIPLIAWGFADLFRAAREIEFNTRVSAGITEPTTAEVEHPASDSESK